jgi:CubicO group peptidase (beta-lactamase class C family)
MMADGPDIKCLQDYLSSREAEGFSGAVIVAQGDNIVIRKEYGVAARDGKDTAFWIASISKAITATAVLKLAEDGLLDLNAPLSKYLPEVPTALADVTVHHLLTHRSGLPHAYSADGVVDRAAAARAIFQQKPERKPGEFGYSNDGYNLLAILIETVSGESFENYLRRQVFKPAGMDGAGFWGFEPDDTSLAPPLSLVRTLSARPTIWRNGRSVANWGFRGASGIYATAEDLFRFARSLESGRLLKKKTFADMTSSKNPSLGPNAQTYGYGWALRFKDGRLTEYWHGGNEDWLGHNGMLKVIGDRTYVVLTNSGDLKKESWAGHIEAGLQACEKN